MRTNSWVKSVSTINGTLVALILLAGNAVMQGQTVKGVINGRSGATMTLQTVDTPKLVVLLTPTTEVGEVQGALKAQTKEMAVTSLILAPWERLTRSSPDKTAEGQAENRRVVVMILQNKGIAGS